MPSPRLLKGLMGAGAAALTAGIGLNQEAEAMPPGIFKPIKKAVIGVTSSALKRLKGQTVKGRVIKDIRKSGNSNWRHIIFEDSTEMIVDKKDIHALSRAKGTQSYVQKFREANQESRTTQALKSMQMRESHVQANPYMTKQNLQMHHKDYLKQVKQIGLEAPDTVFVKRGQKHFQMPREYAEHLEDLGILKIVSSKSKKVVKPKKQTISDMIAQFNQMNPGHKIKYDGPYDLSALNKPPIYQFTAYDGPAKGASFSVDQPTAEAVNLKLQEMIKMRQK